MLYKNSSKYGFYNLNVTHNSNKASKLVNFFDSFTERTLHQCWKIRVLLHAN